MKTEFDSAEELKTIRKLMEESGKFLSISGFSGIFMGLFAIAGAIAAHFLILGGGLIKLNEDFRALAGNDFNKIQWLLAADAIIVLLLSLLAAFFFSYRKAKRSGKSFMSAVARRLFINLFIPMGAGGIFALILLSQGHIELIIPVFLIFYGTGLINAWKFSYVELFYLGLAEIITGLASAYLPSLGLFFWIIGFGLFHILYGLFMYRRYES